MNETDFDWNFHGISPGKDGGLTNEYWGLFEDNKF